MLTKDSVIPVITLPPEYMRTDATEDMKAVYLWAVDSVECLQDGTQLGLVMPSFIDPVSGEELFNFRLEWCKENLKDNDVYPTNLEEL